jgi:hypothetical protein
MPAILRHLPFSNQPSTARVGNETVHAKSHQIIVWVSAACARCSRGSLSPKYRDTLGTGLLKNVAREFEFEFPACDELGPFLRERGYDRIKLTGDWTLSEPE